MMIDKVQDISFATFYMSEFFLQVEKKCQQDYSSEHFEILQKLARFLMKEEPLVIGLERLAQYKGANELSIFLFDMSERIKDYAPQMIFGSLPEQVDDFINLFTLIMEDKDSVADLKKLVRMEDTAEARTEELLSFNEFLEQEKENAIKRALAMIADQNQRRQIQSFLEICRTFETGQAEYLPAALTIAEQVKNLFHLPRPDQPALQSIQKINETETLINTIAEFARENPVYFKKALDENTLPDVQAAEAKAEPLTVDALLQEYFISEVSDYVERVRTLIEKAKSGLFSELIKTFRALKEISMIHGHHGIEYFIAQIIKTLQAAEEEKRSISKDSPQAFEHIFAEMQKIENFGDKDERQIEKIQTLVKALQDTLIEEKRITEEISFDDKKKLFEAFRESLAALHRKTKALAGEEAAPEAIATLLKHKSRHFTVLHPDIEPGFFTPLIDAYTSALSLPQEEQRASLEKIDEIWEQVIHEISSDYDFSVLKEKFSEVQAPEAISLENKEEIKEIFTDIQRRLWQAADEDFRNILLKRDAAAGQKSKACFRLFHKNIELLGYTGFKDAAAYFLSLISADEETIYNEEQTMEAAQSFSLILDRIGIKGSQGDATDILSVLRAIMEEAPAQEQEPPAAEEEQREQASAEIAGPHPPAAELSEDEQFFRDEGLELISVIRESLEELDKNPGNRGPFKLVENAFHNIRSSAHLLNKEKIVNFSVSLEEAAEMFESGDVPMPAELIPEMKSCVSVLEKLIIGEEADVESAEQNMSDVLNRLILEEPQKAEELLEKEEEPDEKAIPQDQPLFAENEDFDEELLQIFKDESEKFIATLEKENEHLKNDPDDMESLKRLDYAAHSLKSAAKMLGFREISQLTDGLEEIVEAIEKKQIANSPELQENISIAIETIKKFRDGEKISSASLAEIIRKMDVAEKRIQEPVTGKKEDRKFVAEVFLNEAGELLEKLNNDFLELEKMPESATLIANIMRNLHTLKGSAMMVRFEKIGELAHKLEDYFQVYKRQNALVKEEMINPAFTSLDIIQDMIKSIKEGQKEITPGFTSKIAEIDNKLYFYQNRDAGQPPESDSAAEQKKSKKPALKKEDESVIKINTAYLDKLINMATELVVNRTELAGHFDNLKELLLNIEVGRKQIHQAKNVLDDLLEDMDYAREDRAEHDQDALVSEEDEGIHVVSDSIKDLTQAVDKISSELNRLSQGFEKNIQQISNLSKSLHSDILKVRMLPVEHLFNRFPRMVRDMASRQKKKINLTIEGNNAELDRAMIEALVDPIMHILRNAIDHGIEDGDERKKLNKNKTGNITLRARQEKNQVLIDISDDGRGIDLERVKERLLQKGIATEESISRMTEAEILDYIFYPEFSTKEEVNDVSGRGVGLDVVANQIQKLKGIIRIRTEKNIGTTFSIRVPLTLVISQALLTRQSKTQIAIPLIAVQESLEIERRDILMDDKRKYVQVHGKMLPYITLEEILNYNDEHDLPAKRPVVILHDAGVSVAMGIGEITGRQEIVIKSLGDQIQNIEYIAGGTILSNGEVALILDYAAVIRLVEFQFFGNIKASRNTGRSETPGELYITKSDPTISKFIEKKTIIGRKPRILVVDDSSSVRTFVGSVLDKTNYSTIRASDGRQAYNIIEKEIIDLIITDLEMPEMDGFELIRQIRAQKKYDDIPIVILTGRSGQKQREKGEAMGANSFIGKPFKESDLLRVVSDFIEISSE